MKVFIDAGHNNSGADTGAVGNGVREQDITFFVAKNLGKRLEKRGIEALYSRNNKEDNVGTSVATSVAKRVEMANDAKADLFISIHCNSSSNPAANGTETLVFSKDSKAYPLAEAINKNLVTLGLSDRGVKVRSNLAVLKNTNMPSVLVELAFISNPNDAVFLINCQNEMAEAICHAIIKFLGRDEHWAKKYYKYLIDKDYKIFEERFDDFMTRGEMFKLMAHIEGFKE